MASPQEDAPPVVSRTLRRRQDAERSLDATLPVERPLVRAGRTDRLESARPPRAVAYNERRGATR